MKIFRYSLLWALTALLLAAFFYRPVLDTLTRNSFSVQLSAAVNASPANLPVLEQQLQDIPYPACYSNWISGLIAARLGQTAESQLKWALFMQCSSQAVDLVQAIAPNDQVLATLAVKLYPDDITPLYWLAGALEKNKDDQSAVSVYQQIVQMKPGSGLAWCQIGNFQEKKKQLQTALLAYINCCTNGDSGFSGCYGAGRMAEKLGYLSQAISYYRLSKWPTALQHADKLEQQLQQP